MVTVVLLLMGVAMELVAVKVVVVLGLCLVVVFGLCLVLVFGLCLVLVMLKNYLVYRL